MAKTRRRKRLYKVFIIEAGARRFFDNSLAVSKAKAENNIRHRFCMETYGEEVSRQVLDDEQGIRFEAEPVKPALPPVKQSSLFGQQGMLFQTFIPHTSR